MTQSNTFYGFSNADNRTDEIIRELKSEPGLYNRYLSMNQEWKGRFLDFCQGKKTLPLTYDPFFKAIFHTDIHPDRLSRLISSLLGIRVRVVKVLPAEESLLDGGALMIMDILVELEDGALANVEIQKIPYAFPGERISCYSSDLVMRQYSRVKGDLGSGFTYRDMKKVYTIVIFERSIGAFHEKQGQYIHMGRTVFDTGLDMELLQEYCLVALDVFSQFPYPKVRSEQTAWLSLLAAENFSEAEELIREYPWMEDIYREMAGLMHNPKEVLNMFSDALRILDHNTVQYMIEEQKKEIDEQKKEIDEKSKEIERKNKEIAEREKQTEEIERERVRAEKEKEEAEIKEKEAVIQRQQLEALLQEKEAHISELMALLEHK